MEPQWWSAKQLENDERFVVSNDGSYFDYDADLSIEEMKELHEEFKKAAVADVVYGLDQWQEIINPKLELLDKALYSQSDDYSHFHVTVFEWESGL
jgi:hypothetical protein